MNVFSLYGRDLCHPCRRRGFCGNRLARRLNRGGFRRRKHHRGFRLGRRHRGVRLIQRILLRRRFGSRANRRFFSRALLPRLPRHGLRVRHVPGLREHLAASFIPHHVCVALLAIVAAAPAASLAQKGFVQDRAGLVREPQVPGFTRPCSSLTRGPLRAGARDLHAPPHQPRVQGPDHLPHRVFQRVRFRHELPSLRVRRPS
mmetsp:Transcript_742/g.2830  ORF Transcript_742/g.2830 Transcript_742/m.2830 type:complete len:202 (+) Transcript_742:1247-1852(+)